MITAYLLASMTLCCIFNQGKYMSYYCFYCIKLPCHYHYTTTCHVIIERPRTPHTLQDKWLTCAHKAGVLFHEFSNSRTSYIRTFISEMRSTSVIGSTLIALRPKLPDDFIFCNLPLLLFCLFTIWSRHLECFVIHVLPY